MILNILYWISQLNFGRSYLCCAAGRFTSGEAFLTYKSLSVMRMYISSGYPCSVHKPCIDLYEYGATLGAGFGYQCQPPASPAYSTSSYPHHDALSLLPDRGDHPPTHLISQHRISIIWVLSRSIFTKGWSQPRKNPKNLFKVRNYLQYPSGECVLWQNVEGLPARESICKTSFFGNTWSYGQEDCVLESLVFRFRD